MSKQTGYPFPNVPKSWSQDGQRFAMGLRYLFDRLFGQQITEKDVSEAIDIKTEDLVKITEVYPVGVVVLNTSEDSAPFSFGTWTAVTTGIDGVYGWERTE